MNDKVKIIKEEHHWTSDEKIKWLGYGEWIEECDVTEFEYLGYQALVMRVMKRELYCPHAGYFGGHLCGYVGIPETHPYFRKKELDIDGHHGITFNEAHEEHWIGFDCGHTGDYIPTVEHMRKTNPELKKINEMFPLKEGFEKFGLFNPVYRNMEYCIQCCIEIIYQLIAALNNDKKSAKEIESDTTEQI
jgi:hypothetical protein